MSESRPPDVPSDAARQTQFLDVISRDEAEARFRRHLSLEPLGPEDVPLLRALGRVLSEDVVATIDVPGFDRSNVDGFAVRAADTHGAAEETPCRVALNDETLSPGHLPNVAVAPGWATPIATGGVLPRGADAVLMVEDSDLIESPPHDGANPLGDATTAARNLAVTRAVALGANVTFAGTDVARGETALRAGHVITSREIGVLAALGRATVSVRRRPRVAILSTGDEIVAPGEPLPSGSIYDSNHAILAAAVEELGGDAVPLGIVPDDEAALSAALAHALACDIVLLSGGTSKGAGDLSYRVVGRLGPPGVVAHGVALKPGKPICLAVHEGKPVVILPGFPTSAIFTFHEFVAPVIRALAGRREEPRDIIRATLPHTVHSERGRTEYLLVGLVRTGDGFAAYPMGKGSGSVTTFSLADGFLTIPQHTERLDAGAAVDVRLLARSLEPADLVVIGSHCAGLDILLSEMERRGWRTRTMHVGSSGGLAAAKRGECDVAGMHLVDPATGEYNRTLLPSHVAWIPGYRRMQTIVFRPGDARFKENSPDKAVAAALADADCTMVNRNAGSGTRILIDKLLAGRQPPGYGVQTKSHNAVAAAVHQGRADWGVAIDTVARLYGLAMIPLLEEHYDFAIPAARKERPAVRAFLEILADPSIRDRLRDAGFLL